MQVDSLLSQISYPYKGRVRTDIMQLMQKTPTLRPSVGEIVHNDGTRASLLMLDGTIPMFVANVKYNAPVALYIVYQYPEAAPLVYVRPVTGMAIKPGHPFVDNSGLVKDTYLLSWRAASSSLCGLVDALSQSFSSNPPVYSKPAGQPRPQYSYGSTPASAATPPTSLSGGGYTSGYLSGVGYGSSQTTPQQKPQAQTQPQSTYGRPAHTTSKKDELVAKVTARLQEEMTIYYSRVRDEIDKEFACQSDLSHRREAATEKTRDLTNAKRELEREISRFKLQKEQLDKWASEHAADPPPEAEAVVVPYDGISSQLAGLLAENLAIDDMMYYLERALASQQNKTVDLPIFLREVRNLSGKQFTNKLHIRRIEAVVSGGGG